MLNKHFFGGQELVNLKDMTFSNFNKKYIKHQHNIVSCKNVQLANQVYVGPSKQMIKTKNLTLLCSINRLRVKDQSKIRSVKEKMGLRIRSCLYHL
jgi:hypothetical protein